MNTKKDSNPDIISFCKTINCVLLMNKMQRLIMQKVFYCLINRYDFCCNKIQNQLLLYI